MKRALLSLLFFAVSLVAYSQDTSRFTDTNFWKISGNGLEQPSYIWGSHHLFPSNFALNHPGFKSAFYLSDRIVTEMLEGESKSDRNMFSMKGVSYRDLLNDDEFHKLDSLLMKCFDEGLDELGELSPNALRLGISSELIMELIDDLEIDYSGGRIDTPIDFYIGEMAHYNNKETYGFETKKYQNKVINKYIYYRDNNLHNQAKSLLDELMALDYSQEIALSIENYVSGNLDGGYARYLAMIDNDIDNDELLKKRNDRWMKKLPAILREKSNLIVVGAAHLSGDIGLLHRLDAMGYTVEPIK